MAGVAPIGRYPMPMHVLRSIIGYGLLVAALWALMTYIPRLRPISAHPDYADIEGLDPRIARYRVDPDGIARLGAGDAICYRLADDEEHATLFGWVAALAGQRVEIVVGRLQVDGKPSGAGNLIDVPLAGPLLVPPGHIFVVSSHHRYDSIAVGPLPLTAVRGTVGDLP